MAKDVRTRNWLFIFYPESCPAEWRDIIAEWQLGVYVSPLHDEDFTSEGEHKKAHYHGILCFDGPQTYSRALGLVSDLGCATCKPCNSLSAAVRYLCHLDSPDKAQYDVSDIEMWGPVDLSPIEIRSESVVDFKTTQLVRIIVENSITEFSELVDFVIAERSDLLSVLRGNTQFFRGYLASRRGILK